MSCSVGLKYAKNGLAAGAPPRTPLGGAHDAPPRPPSRLERGTPPPHSPPSRRLRRLDCRAFGASILVHPWKPGALELATVLNLRLS